MNNKLTKSSPIAYVHVGTHKTGSTYLQKWLLQNRDVLSDKCGIYYPVSGFTRQQHRDLAIEISDYVRNGRNEGNGFRDLRKEIMGRDKDILLSSEMFEDRIRKEENVNYLKDFFATCGYKVVVVAYIREQADYINSRYAQDVRRMHYNDNFCTYIEYAKESIWFNYDKLFKFVMRCNDLDFMARSFHLACKVGIEVDLLRVLTGNSVLSAADLEDAGFKSVSIQNESCGPKTVFLSRLVQAELAIRFPDLKRSDMLNVNPWGMVRKIGLNLGWNESKFIGMTPELAQCVATQRFFCKRGLGWIEGVRILVDQVVR